MNLSTIFFLVSIIKSQLHFVKSCTEGTPLPHPTDCTKFFLCGRPFEELTCMPPLRFNEKVSACDWPKNVDCSGSSNNQVKLGVNVKSHSINYLSCSTGTIIPHPSDCSSFIRCGPSDEENVSLNFLILLNC